MFHLQQCADSAAVPIVFLDRGTIGPTVDLTRPAFCHQWVEHDATQPGEVVGRLAGARIAITNKVPIRAQHLKELPHLKMIAVAATGYDVIDVAACRERGIVVANVRGYAVSTVPEHTFALILALRRGLVGYRQDVIDGRWQEAGQFCLFTHPIRELAGSTLGIIGEGAIGQSVARLGQAFGMRTLFAAHKGVSGLGPLYTPWDEVLETSDVITLHCPLTAGTLGMIALPEFRKMKRRPLIINTARGSLVAEGDLVRALEEGLISGAGFDCLTAEPPPRDHPFSRIMGRPDVIITPHVGWASLEAMQACWQQVIDNIERFEAGRPSNTVV
ncbi:MAG: D-2-hydroxyacid dehydrogenase [Hyphomicrobiaceae bacterium]|nr:D-2-hydroxyacid dehydrogenase [Hyphomicrobiaceae bacterium]